MQPGSLLRKASRSSYPISHYEEILEAKYGRLLRAWIGKQTNFYFGAHLSVSACELSNMTIAGNEKLLQAFLELHISKGFEMSIRALLLIDLQKEYTATGKLPLVGIDLAVANAAEVLAKSRQRGDRIVHVHHIGGSKDAPVFTPGSQGTEVITEVRPMAGEAVIQKNYPNSFRATSLDELLRREGVTDIVIIGAMSHMCIDATTRAAADLGYNVTLIHDACATRDLEFAGRKVNAADVHAAFVSALGYAYAKVVTAAEFTA